jgi:oxygen-independent coproporphyrinogen-3 oxidase
MTRLDLFAKYDLPVPRYTSYPTVPQWHRPPTTAEWTTSLDRAMRDPGASLSLYVHLPFCESLCTFCGCNNVITRDHTREDPYVARLLRELDLYLGMIPALASVPLRQIHLGGGTPTFLSESVLAGLIDGIALRLPDRGEDFEGSVEVDPRVTRLTHLETLAARGFRRISLGVQDLDPEVQRLVNRLQPLELTANLCRAARTLGYESVNFDLIYGLPGQTRASMKRLIDAVLDLFPDRLAVYSFARVPWIKPAQRRFRDDQVPEGAEKRALYEAVRAPLLDAGYVEIGMDHFARPDDALARAAAAGRLHRNFQGYTDVKTTSVVGLGVSAISATPDCYHQNEKVLPVYERRIDAGELATFRGHVLSPEDQRRRRQIAEVMTTFRVALDRAEAAEAPGALAPLLQDGLVRTGDRFSGTSLPSSTSTTGASSRRVPPIPRPSESRAHMHPAIVRVVGAGLSGLATAWWLAEAGHDVEVLEASTDPGGLIATVPTAHGLVERAADGLAWNDTTARLFQALDLTPVFASALASRRYIFRDGRPRRWPLRASETTRMVLRAATARMAGRARPAADESMWDFARRVFGPAAARWLVAPALQGVYGTTPHHLSAAAVLGQDSRSLASRYRGANLASPSGGMGELIARLVDRLRRRGVVVTLGRAITALDASVPTVVATDARSAALLVRPHAPALGARIAQVPMTSVVTATAFFAPHTTDLHGFGVLFPRDADVSALGVRFNADVYGAGLQSPWRSETWISASDDPAVPLPDDDRALAALMADREVLTGRRDEPVAVHITRRPEALPVYGPGVLEIKARLGDLPPWLALAGNYMGRIGAAKLLDVAREAAERITAARPCDG